MANKYYVYGLLDPRKNNQPFYIGKGSGIEHNNTYMKQKKTLRIFAKFLKSRRYEPLDSSLSLNILPETLKKMWPMNWKQL
jgi:hypothetical protein